MDYTGQIKDMYRGMDGKFTISLYIEEEPGDIEKLKDKRLQIKIAEYKQKRSLNANAYFHPLFKIVSFLTEKVYYINDRKFKK